MAAIAVPNFLEAQTRAKVSRAKADIRSLATALESYAVDNNKYPLDITDTSGMNRTPAGYFWYISNRITTPISYITDNQLIDPFRDRRSTLPPVYWRFRYVNYSDADYYAANPAILPGGGTGDYTSQSYYLGAPYHGAWRLSSAGPDAVAGANGNFAPPPLVFVGPLIAYDPTNGTVSWGDIVRCQKDSDMKAATY
ncbi:MAG: type II secretion system protein GspG [Candidatus Sumerlaeaceae bacterium]|nr:type II secretion system protein GspG [Candidatus Sumerlaeaceae bacterium]